MGVVTFLEMTSPDQLLPSRPSQGFLEVAKVGQHAAPVLRSMYVQIWEPLISGGRSAWTDEQWVTELSRPEVHAWLAKVGDDLAGFVELESDTQTAVGIVVFGLLPRFQGRGLGGAFLTRATELAWNLALPNGKHVTRVWLQTSSDDHPHALSNYKRRGFRVSGSPPESG